MRILAAGLLLATSLWALPSSAQNIQRIGVAAAAVNQVTGALGTTQRALKTGDGVTQNEQIKTGAASSAQILFSDETTLTMGADSVIVLDKAVYDPNTRTGEIAVRAVSGAFRFVSGSSPSGNYTINTPAGTVGVRGTIVDIEILGSIILAIVREGDAEYCSSPGNCVIVKAGNFIVISGGQVSSPKPINNHACGMTGLGGGQTRCAAALLGSLVDFANLPKGNLGPDFQPGTFTGGPPPGFGGVNGAGSCAVLLPSGNCFSGVGAPGRGTAPPGLIQ